MFFIYQFLILLIIIISPLIVILRIIKNKEDKIRFKEKFCFFSKKRGSGKLVWFHGASVGEIMSILPIIYDLDKNKKIKKILITSSTLSSSKVLQKIKFKKVVHQFFPVDYFYFSNKFLDFWKPDSAIFLESEIWPSMFKSLKKKNIPLILLNARVTPKTYNRWIKIKKFSKSIFGLINFAYPQNNETKFFLKKLSVKKIKFIGNLKFIGNKKLNYDNDEKYLFKHFKKYKTFVAASTHPSEEILAAKTHLLLKKKYKNLITILIPRHIHRVNNIIDELKKLKLNIVVHSSNNKNLKNKDIYLVDTFGESKKFYKIASTVFMGGSIIDKGGQNPLEPARYGAKILHGPNVGNFKEIYKYLNSLNISSKVRNSNQILNSIKFKKNMSNVIKIDNIGRTILQKTLKELNKPIHNET